MDKDFKPIHLKGLFSVSTASRKVLDRMQISRPSLRVRSPVLATIVGADRLARTRLAKPLARWSRKHPNSRLVSSHATKEAEALTFRHTQERSGASHVSHFTPFQQNFVPPTSQPTHQPITLGLGSSFNHAENPNVSFSVDIVRERIVYTSTRAIQPDQELCIFYGHQLWIDPVSKGTPTTMSPARHLRTWMIS
ncbi:hypothetical protein L210DRAFT_602758 [Boletus edulis BED1]|uniref:SET domain-containing protein n=1 Tax=Boletus edulis BED1 TaxID=1328754 RepID=A0AAD4BPY0_BOLED|nr:hypothetical protein L210DRAFT_602758 [Boletus edulis BED1]